MYQNENLRRSFRSDTTAPIKPGRPFKCRDVAAFGCHTCPLKCVDVDAFGPRNEAA